MSSPVDDSSPADSEMWLHTTNGLVCLDVFQDGKWINLFKYAKHLEGKPEGERLINASENARAGALERAASIAEQYPLSPDIGRMIAELIRREI